MKKRILFVDDEPRVLEGLERMLRPMRSEWETRFAGGGHEALDILSKESFEVVVSDMRMPGMDGAQLLTEVMKRYPQIVRIVLSGHSHRDLVFKSVRPAHQFLSKPCDAEALKTTVTRAFAMRDFLADDGLKNVVSCLDSLPSLPSLYAEVTQELQSQEPSLRKIGEIISKDVGMAAKVLQLVNSAFFGLPRHVSSPIHACSLLGLETIKALVLSIGIFSQLDLNKHYGFSVDALWQHSMSIAVLAKAIAKNEVQDPTIIDDAFMAGLLHDVGKLILAVGFPEEYGAALAAAEEKRISHWEAEREVFATTHSAVGAYLMGLWGLPDAIVEALAFHHKPSDFPGDRFSSLVAVHVADAIAHETLGKKSGIGVPHLDLEYLAEVNVADRLPRWRAVCEEAMQEGAADE